MRHKIATTVCATIVCAIFTSACESREQLGHDAEARAERWGYRSPRVVHDIVYAQYGRRQLKLDLYLPPASDPHGRAPGVIAVRGGAFCLGDKEGFAYLAARLALAGFVVASIEYRTCEEVKFPGPVEDVKAAVRWMRAHAREYGVAGPIGAIGGSAGAYLVAMLATTGGVNALEGNGGNPGESSDIQAAVAMGGAYDLEHTQDMSADVIRVVHTFVGGPVNTPSIAAAASPVAYVSTRSAALLLLHSRTDPVAPFAQAEEMAQQYHRAGASVRLIPVDAPGVHAFWASAQYFPITEPVRLAGNFFREHLTADVGGR